MEQEKVNQIAKKLGLILIDNGMRFIQSAFHLNPIKVSSEEIDQILRKYFASEKISHLDSFYYLIPINQWKELIAVDWTETKKWVEDRYDCDNFSNYFSANMAMFYEINSAGRVYGKYYQGLNKFMGYHYFNVIIDSDKKIWFFEPGNDKLTEAEYVGGTILIGGNKYEVVQFIFG